MGGLGDHAGEMIYILLAILLIVAVMFAVMSLTKTAKKSTNQKTAELGQQVADVDNQFFEDWDMNTCNGSQLKQLIKSASGKDCAILVQTLSLLGNQPTWGSGSASDAKFTSVAAQANGVSSLSEGDGAKEATFNGVALNDAQKKLLPVVMIDVKDGNVAGSHRAGTDTNGSSINIETAAFPTQTALKTRVYNSCLINYGTILKNAVKSAGVTGENYESILADSGANGVQGETTIEANGWDTTSGDFAQTIAYLDGRFHTKQEFAVSQSGVNLRYDSMMDISMSGKTMYIDDNAKFNSYILVDGANKYKGLVFIEKK